MSHFDPKIQANCIDSKIVGALERVTQAFRVMMWNSSKSMSLSPIQMKILIFIKYHSIDKCRVSYLADELNVTKATVSDAVKSLIKKSYLHKKTCTNDGRRVYLQLTKEGVEVATQSALFSRNLGISLNEFSQQNKEQFLQHLMQLVFSLNNQEVIKVQRMCQTCQHHSKSDAHYCKFLNQSLTNQELRVDCPNHQMKEA